LKAGGKQVFLDWKLHDIGTTVQRAAAVLAGSGCDFLTVHGEPQVMAAAVRGRGGSGLKILAVTVLTSLANEDLAEMGFVETARALVERRIHQAIAAGCDGVIASPHEAALARTLGIAVPPGGVAGYHALSAVTVRFTVVLRTDAAAPRSTVLLAVTPPGGLPADADTGVLDASALARGGSTLRRVCMDATPTVAGAPVDMLWFSDTSTDMAGDEDRVGDTAAATLLALRAARADLRVGVYQAGSVAARPGAAKVAADALTQLLPPPPPAG
jgi:hypothetical protein